MNISTSSDDVGHGAHYCKCSRPGASCSSPQLTILLELYSHVSVLDGHCSCDICDFPQTNICASGSNLSGRFNKSSSSAETKPEAYVNTTRFFETTFLTISPGYSVCDGASLPPTLSFFRGTSLSPPSNLVQTHRPFPRRQSTKNLANRRWWCIHGLLWTLIKQGIPSSGVICRGALYIIPRPTNL